MPIETQERLLRRADWNALIVLDACRADSYRRRRPRARVALTMGYCTRVWMPQLARVLDGAPTLYVSANPVCERELQMNRDNPNFRWISLWRDRWERVGPHKLPTVHPRSVRDALMDYLNRFGQPERIVVHFIQPHMPYVGEAALPYADWGNCGRCEFAGELHKTTHPRDAVAQRRITRKDVRAAYEGNLDLVLPYAIDLAEQVLAGTVVVTADHGELLGEGGKYGHMAGPVDTLMRVPWEQWDKGGLTPAELPDQAALSGLDTEESQTMHNRLEALGYE